MNEELGASSMNDQYLTDPCSPYERGHGNDPVNIWEIIDRLSPQEQRSMVMAFSVHAKAAFEDKLLRLWAARQRHATTA